MGVILGIDIGGSSTKIVGLSPRLFLLDMLRGKADDPPQQSPEEPHPGHHAHPAVDRPQRRRCRRPEGRRRRRQEPLLLRRRRSGCGPPRR